MEQQTWVSLAALAGFALALFTYLGAIRRDLKSEISGLRSELKSDISDLRTELADTRAELKAEIHKLDGRMTVMEQRTYDLRGLLSPAPHTGN